MTFLSHGNESHFLQCIRSLIRHLGRVCKYSGRMRWVGEGGGFTPVRDRKGTETLIGEAEDVGRIELKLQCC
jgi:hypothetical protein